MAIAVHAIRRRGRNCTVAHYVLLVMLVEVLGADAVAASTAGTTLGALVNYLLNRRYTCRSNKRHGEALTKFLIIAASWLALNASLMLIFVDILSLYYLLAQVLSTGLVLVWNLVENSSGPLAMHVEPVGFNHYGRPRDRQHAA